jgi:hypothetical protein
VIWNFNDLSFLEERRFTLVLNGPQSNISNLPYPLKLTITSSEIDLDTSNNTTTVNLIARFQLFLPIITR